MMNILQVALLTSRRRALKFSVSATRLSKTRREVPTQRGVMAKKIELYEIIANRLQDSGRIPPPKSGDLNADENVATVADYEIPLPARLQRRGEREVVLSLEAAFLIFVVFLLLLATAYSLGLKKGEQQTRDGFRPTSGKIALGELAELSTVKGATVLTAGETVKIPAERYTLKLATAETAKDLETIRTDLLANPVINQNRVDSFIFDNRGKFVLALGIFSKPDDDILTSMQKFLREQKINGVTYKNTSVELVSDLGKAIK